MTTPPACGSCDDTGHVCENHPGRPWSGLSDAATACGCGAGEPCAGCCDPVPLDGSVGIGDAFTPTHLRHRIEP